MDNNHFALTEEQLEAYRSWVSGKAAPLWKEDCAESIEVSITFYFSVLGRRVEARLGESVLVLEGCQTTHAHPDAT